MNDNFFIQFIKKVFINLFTVLRRIAERILRIQLEEYFPLTELF